MVLTDSPPLPNTSETTAAPFDGDSWAEDSDDSVLPLARLCGAAALAILALATASLVLV